MSDTTVTKAETFACEQCDKVSPTKAGLKAHERAKHGLSIKVEPPTVTAPAAEPVAAAKPQKLKPFPYHEGGVNENTALRVLRMAWPECPVTTNMDDSQIALGMKVYTGDANCQQRFKKNNQGVWDVAECEKLGHDPYYFTVRRVREENIVGEDGVITGKREIAVEERRLRIIQPSDNPRHSAGMEVQLAIARGARPLSDFGIEEPCQMRNCTKPQRVHTRYGDYCSERHARLVGADRRGIFLFVGGDALTEDRGVQEFKEDLLENLNISAVG